MKWFILLLLLLPHLAPAQSDSVEAFKEIESFQRQLNDEYRNPDESPLEPEEIKQFKGHDFFTIDLTWRVTATLVKTQNAKIFKMKTTGARRPDYRQYGELHFVLQGKSFKLNVYQSIDLMKKEKYRDHLFLPFTDSSNDSLSYGAGRYIDLHIPQRGDKLIIDFNQAYNPFCAYSHKYSCPVVPAENHLNLAVLAGVRMVRKD